MVFHLGAISDTTATDGDLAWATNVELPRRLWDWCADARGAVGLRLLGGDLWRRRRRASTTISACRRWSGCARSTCTAGPSTRSTCWWRAAWRAGQPRPPQWAGLKFFNVYRPERVPQGPHDLGGEGQARRGRAGGPAPRCSAPTAPAWPTARRQRDFIWVDDVVDVMLWLLDTPAVSGLFNVGTGRARSYLDLAHAVCDAAGVPRAGGVHRHAGAAARAVPVLHRGADGAAARRRLRGPVHAAGGRACGATCRTTWRSPTRYR